MKGAQIAGIVLLLAGVIMLTLGTSGATLATLVVNANPAGMNPHVGCTPTVTTLATMFTQWDPSTGGALMQGSTIAPLNQFPQYASGDQGKRALTAPYPNPEPCTGLTTGTGTVTLPTGTSASTFVELDGVFVDASSTIDDNAAGGDCSTNYQPYNVLNGITTHPLTCDSYTNLRDPGFTNGCEVSSTLHHACAHVEIDMDWRAAGFCGSGTTCDNATFDRLTSTQAIDVQGFLFWDALHVASGGHNWSGWELHPLTGFRLHAAAPPPSLQFTYLPLSPITSDIVTLSASVTNPPTSYTVSWSFGDGATGSGITTTHTWTTAGSYSVTAQIIVAGSIVTGSTQTIVVKTSTQITSSFTISPNPTTLGQGVTFSATASGGTAPYTFSWNFGDGGAAGGGNPVSHTYGAVGNFQVILTVTDSTGASNVAPTQVATIQQPVTGLTVTFTWSPLIPVTGQVVYFATQINGGAPQYNATWSFGDGTMIQGMTPNHIYAGPGTYQAKVTVVDTLGNTAIAQNSITIQNPPPQTCPTGQIMVNGVCVVQNNFFMLIYNWFLNPLNVTGIGLVVAGTVVMATGRKK